MKAINYILGFGASAAAATASIFCARVGCFGMGCGYIRLAAAGWMGMIWFGALAIKCAAMAIGAERL